MSNTFGKIFKITTFGESHGKGVGVVIDGCPAGVEISKEEIQSELNRRRPGQNLLTTQRQEKDEVKILSGIFEGKTLGTPITLVVYNEDANSKSYEDIKDKYRPGHADYTYEAKYGIHDWRGGGRASARETLARVAAGAVAKKILNKINVQVIGYVKQIGNVQIETVDENIINKNDLYCPDESKYDEMVKEIEQAKKDNDSVGGIVEVVAHGVSTGLGEPVFDKLSANLAHALMGIPAVKGFEIGDGFAVASMRGSENNDELIKKQDGKIGTKTNHAGGIVGGISNGEDIVVRVALKPTSSISKKQKTVDSGGNEVDIEVEGRHDPCVCPRAVPVCEAMMNLVLVDNYLMQKVQN